MMARMATTRDAPLVGRQTLPDAYALLTFRHPEVSREARAGQFVMLKAGRSPDLPLRRPFSVMATDPVGETFTVFVKAVGPSSRALNELPVGALASCTGPLGRAFRPPESGTTSLLVGGGFGIAPFFLFTTELLRGGRDFRIFYGGRTASDLALRDAFDPLRVPLVVATEDGSLGERGQVTAPLLADLAAGREDVALFACGPGGLLRAVARIGEERKLPVQVSLDPWMGCGIGTCLGCVVPIQEGGEPHPHYRCACTEGPVFDAATVVWPGDSESASCRERRREP
jgi:dihydroorotate dehydrogenase electron transfer subunit